MIEFATAEGTDWRLTSLTLKHGSVNTVNWNGAVMVCCGTKAFRIDHVKFDDLDAPSVRVYGDTWGVIDHSVFYTKIRRMGIIVWHNSWGGIGTSGDNSWATPVEWGTRKAVYIEDNLFTGDHAGEMIGMIDAFAGGRYVARYNTFLHARASSHGTDSTDKDRGMRSLEVYNNIFTSATTGSYAAIYLRSGTGVVFINTCKGFANCVLAANYRSASTFKTWGQCDGTNGFDGNQGPQVGYPCLDQVGRGMGVLMQRDATTRLPMSRAWPENTLEPLYVWGNILNGSKVGSQHSVILRGRDFIEGPKPGYKPFVYPHPLVSGASAAAPPTPTNLSVQ
jgi:hypothetical protein